MPAPFENNKNMETIKITDKLTLRQEALRMAMNNGHEYRNPSYLFEDAKRIAEYLQGSAVLPEYSDHDKQITEMLAKMQDSFKPTPLSMWISADSEMKPAKGVEVVCALHYGSKIEYLVMSYDYDSKMWYGGPDDDNTNHVVAWCPIQPLTQPTL